MQIKEIAAGRNAGLLCGDWNTEIRDIVNDSRKAEPGCLYFAIPGARADGADFIPDVIRQGAAAVVTEKNEEEIRHLLEKDEAKNGTLPESAADVTILQVKDARKAMGEMSAVFCGNPSEKLTVIGITGTKGKTTTSYMIRNMLEAAGHRTGLIGTIEILDGKTRTESSNTTPESLTLQKIFRNMVDNGLDSVVMEVSSQALKLNRVAGVDFDYGIFTNLSPDHIGPAEHASYEEYRDCKKKLFFLCKKGIFNGDDPETPYMMEGTPCIKYTYGRSPAADYVASGHKLYREGGILGISYRLEGRMTGDVRVDLPGEFSVYNSLAAIAVADLMGVPAERILEILKTIRVRGRVEMVPISHAFTFMIDYAHNGVALESLLKALREYHPKRIVTIFGCGGNRARSRRYEMGEVSGKYADFTIITSDNPRFEDPMAIIADIETGIRKTDGRYISIPDRKEAVRYAILHAEPGDLIVLAGKGHEDYQEIQGVRYPSDEKGLVKQVLEEEDVSKICGYNHRYLA